MTTSPSPLEALIPWESRFNAAILHIPTLERQKAGALLPVIPSRTEWTDFLNAVKLEWPVWQQNLESNPACLIVLYGGMAFFEYAQHTFWEPFSQAVGVASLPASQYTEINTAFVRVAGQLGLELFRHKDSGNAYVSSAIYYVGIPLSLWDGFLEVCEWAAHESSWKSMQDEKWAEIVRKRSGSKSRLKNFLVKDRPAATIFIQEMLDARNCLSSDEKFSLADVKAICFLRPEYFDEVPETADFLRPNNPESLLQDRARLFWNEGRSVISLHLPPVPRENLPASWQIDSVDQQASANADELVLNSKAFQPTLALRMRAQGKNELQRLSGIEPWGLFDLWNGGQSVNVSRDQLPLRSYVLVSKEKITEIKRSGFEEADNPQNQDFELSDGTKCFITKLWPTRNFADLQLKHQDHSVKIRFRTRSRIEARFYAGRGQWAHNFRRIDGLLELERLPVLCVAIPAGYYDDNEMVLKNKFRVMMDEKISSGVWEKRVETVDDDKEFYFWKWDPRPFLERKASGKVTDFKDIGAFYGQANLSGMHTLSIEAKEFGLNFKYRVHMKNRRQEIERCWQNLPGAFLPWVLLCQSQNGMRTDELMFARDVIAPQTRLPFYLLRQGQEEGLFVRRGRLWQIQESRASFISNGQAGCSLHFCGDPSILWGMYRRLFHDMQGKPLPVITIINEKRSIPFLKMDWDSAVRNELSKYLRNQGVEIRANLWNH